MQSKLFMMLVGCKPSRRNIEQHDLFFAIGESIKKVVDQVKEFWPEGKKSLHLDAWREVNKVGDYAISITEKVNDPQPLRLFFLNLGGYKLGEFEEFHYKMITVAADKGEAVHSAKQTAFFQHTGFKGAVAHIDDKYGVDIDDFYEIADLLSSAAKAKYNISIQNAPANAPEDQIHLGYFKIDTVDKWAP